MRLPLQFNLPLSPKLYALKLLSGESQKTKKISVTEMRRILIRFATEN
jgi:hypothetical protein